MLGLVSLLIAALPGSSFGDEDLNNGEDFTRPPAQYDFRYQFQEKSGGVDQSSFILRVNRPIPLGGPWELSTRLDLPFVLNDGVSADNPNGRTRLGISDVLAQATIIDTVTSRFAYGAGARMVFPTADEDQFGSGKYQLIPIAGARYKLPELSTASFAQLVCRYDFDASGYGGRKHISQIQFSPTLNIGLPDRWFLTLFPSQDIVLSTIGGTKWFVPADFLIGQNINSRTVASVEVSVPVIKQFTLYEFKLEARLSYTF